MDFSTIHPMHCLYNSEFKNEPGYWKIVTMDIIEIVAPRPKSYSILIACERCSSWAECYCSCSKLKRLRGIPRAETCVLTHKMFKESVLENKDVFIESTRPRSVNHEMVMYHTLTNGLQNINMGRLFLKDKIHSLPFGHYALQSIPDHLPIT